LIFRRAGLHLAMARTAAVFWSTLSDIPVVNARDRSCSPRHFFCQCQESFVFELERYAQLCETGTVLCEGEHGLVGEFDARVDTEV
jgi:hypothetical protein